MSPDAKPALRPGDLNTLFDRIVKNAPGNKSSSELTIVGELDLHEYNMTNYTVHILSHPKDFEVTEVSPVIDSSSPPWVIKFENFLTDDECDTMIQLGHYNEFKRSKGMGPDATMEVSYDGIESDSRTSYNTWCGHYNGCRGSALPSRIHDRIERVLNIPSNNSEDFQILRYDVGQFYSTHHDFIDHQGKFFSFLLMLTQFLDSEQRIDEINFCISTLALSFSIFFL
jgi:prolyl 4-hydroxylase